MNQSIAVDLDVSALVQQACEKIAPVWPLKSFVAVNPFLGFGHAPFNVAAETLGRVAGAKMFMNRSYYADLIRQGRISDTDLATALDRANARGLRNLPSDVAALKSVAFTDEKDTLAPGTATVADLAVVVLPRVDALVVEDIAKWCAAYWDQGQASWRMPWRQLTPYAAWRSTAVHDRNAELIGVKGFRASVAQLPLDPLESITQVLAKLGISHKTAADYLYRALVSIGGWAAYARYLGWRKGLDGVSDDTLMNLLAIRLAWDYALFLSVDAHTRTQLSATFAAAAPVTRHSSSPINALLQDAFDIAFMRGLASGLAVGAQAKGRVADDLTRKAVQAVFCIDVRSEVFRRALETVSPDVETFGFAGFFGFALDYRPLGSSEVLAQYPVLLKPSVMICEALSNVSSEEEQEILGLRVLRRRVARAWSSFKTSLVSCFGYVESMGLLFGPKLVGDAFGLTRTVGHPLTEGLPRNAVRKLRPSLRPAKHDGLATGIAPEQRLAMAEGVLRAMSLTDRFARLVVLAGHGSTTVNNPHAAGLDCGACGGLTGQANARVAAAVFNDPDVRAGLKGKGISIPNDTWFVPALHDTTTDEVTIYDSSEIPPALSEDVIRLKQQLVQAGALARMERAALLGEDNDAHVHERIQKRSQDWSQVRPEWGLAGNAAFIAAPRARTQGLKLSGRSFLHTYDHTKDTTCGVLELIMTAPMVVASWINLQYYGSTVDNRLFGSGNKVLHNVVGTLGVLEGNGGDLRTGLPWQSVHDGVKYVHEPLRLNVIIEAPETEMNKILSKHPDVRELVDNGWVNLFSIADGEVKLRRYIGNLSWEPLEARSP